MTTTIEHVALDQGAAERLFWSKVRRGAPDECWEWQCYRLRGYGYLRIAGKQVRAHRVSWVLAARRGLAEDMVVMHSCDNPPCVNPAHLSLGTQAENNADRHAKGRTVMPENGPDFWRGKTHCPQGHPYSGDNVRYRADGRRRCAQCYRDRAAARRNQLNAKRGAR